MSQAARTLGVAQPALSHNIASLETILGTKLFIRSSQGMTLTEDGSLLLEHAHAILSCVAIAEDQLLNRVSDLSGPPVSVGLIPSLTEAFAVPMLERLRQKFPNFRLRLLDGLSDQIESWLLNGELQIGFSTLPKHSSRLVVEHLCDEHLCLVAAPGVVQSAGSTISLSEVIGIPLILNPQPNSVRILLETAAADQGHDLEPWLEFTSFPAIKEAVRRRFGCSVLSWSAIAEDVAEGRLAAYQIVDPPLRRPLQLLSARDHALSHSSRIMKDEILILAHEFVREGRFR